MDEVLAAVDRIESDYEGACRAARAVAEDSLEATRVCARFLEDVGPVSRCSSIFNADDFGYGRGINRGIVEAHDARRGDLGHADGQRAGRPRRPWPWRRAAAA